MTETSQDQPSHSDSCKIKGPARLMGKAAISGFKHSLVVTLAAGLTSEAKLTLSNCPDITEARILKQLVERAGGKVERARDSLALDSSSVCTGALDPDLSGLIHGSVYLVPGLVRRFGTALVKINGGCQIGSGPGGRRPFEHYREILEAFGAVVELLGDGQLQVTSAGFKACHIDLHRYTTSHLGHLGNLYSGATKMAILCAACAEGTSTLANPYSKADVSELIEVLRKLGVEVEDAADGTLSVTVAAERRKFDAHHELAPDLIEVVTWITAAALYCDKSFELVGKGMPRSVQGLKAELELLSKMGISVTATDAGLAIQRPDRLVAVDFVVGHGDSVFSDSQPFLALLAASAEGTTRILEKVWPDRFGYVLGLQCLGAKMQLNGATLVVHGSNPPTRVGQTVDATDLRSAAVLVLAALGVDGTTVVTGTGHLGRGYPDFLQSLRLCGADVQPCVPEGRS